MYVVGIREFEKKDGSGKGSAIQAIARNRYDLGFTVLTVWSSPAEIEHEGLEIGDQIRAFREGGFMITEKHSSLTDPNSLLDFVL